MPGDSQEYIRPDRYSARGPADAAALRGLLRLSSLAEEVATHLADHPDQAVRRAAALLAARAHPLLASLQS